MLELRLKQQMSLHLHFECESLASSCAVDHFPWGAVGKGKGKGENIDSTSFTAVT